jgi:hypothetical protein
MSATPLQVLTRPFAIEPVTNIMLPDGIFDNAIYNLRIAAHVTNMSSSALTGSVPLMRYVTVLAIWCRWPDTRWWHAKAQEFVHGPDVVC